jgi:hypothetical protein
MKKIFKWIAIILGSIVLLSIVSTGDKKEEIKRPTEETVIQPSNTSVEKTNSQVPTVPMEYKSALSQANTYANTLYMSKRGVYAQLVSEYGGQFSPEAAQYAIDNVKADWNTNALNKAKTYQNTMNLSLKAIHDQLISEYGEKFTQEEADYAVEHLDK